MWSRWYSPFESKIAKTPRSYPSTMFTPQNKNSRRNGYEEDHNSQKVIIIIQL